MTDDKVVGEGPYQAEPFGNFSYFVKGPFPAGKTVPVLGETEANEAVKMCNFAYAEGRASRDGLRTALKGLLEDNLDYARINHLGGVENKHWLKAARAALRADEERN